ncbi:MAG: ComEC/Rec2 family competence protein, partial [Gemmatimonas sp.]
MTQHRAAESADHGERAEVEHARDFTAFPFGIMRRLTARLETERDRWFLWLPVFYGIGIAIYFALGEEPPVLLVLMPVPIAMVAWLVLRRGTLTVLATGAALALTLGLAAAKIRTSWVTAPVLERQMNLAEVRGWVELVEPRAGRGQRLTLRVAAIRGLTAEQLPARIRVRTMVALPGLVPGDAIRVRATLAPPAIPSLPGDYDFARAAFFQRLGGVGYALAQPERDTTLGAVPRWLQLEASIARVRLAIGQRVRAALPGERGAIADALITGERGGISEATNGAYRNSGLFHILSISGLHMTVMAGAVFLALRFLLAAIPAIALRYPIKKWAAAAATLAAFGYLLISGGSFATVRSWVTISIMFLAVLLDRPAIALRNVAVSALVILVVLPDSLLDVGFQMSYAAVVALVASFEALRERQSRRDGGMMLGPMFKVPLFFGAIVLTTLIASIAVAPFAAYHFHTSQQYAIFANLIAIPVCNVVVMPAALATLVLMPLGLEGAALWVMGLGIDVMTWCAKAVAVLPGAVARLPAFPQLGFGLMVAGGLWL